MKNIDHHIIIVLKFSHVVNIISCNTMFTIMFIASE